MGLPATQAQTYYRRLIADYVSAAMLLKRWKQPQLARAIGKNRSTIWRAVHAKHDTDMVTLQAIERATGLPIPQELTDAALAAKNRVTEDSSGPAVPERIDQLPPAIQTMIRRAMAGSR